MADVAYLSPIFVESSDPAGAYSGTTPDVARSYYDEIYNWGIASAMHYGIELKPYFEDSLLATSNIQLYGANELQQLLVRIKANNGDYQTPEQGDSNILLADSSFGRVLPWLAQSINTSNINAQAESVQLGSQQINFMNGCSSPEITINFIETRNFAISNSIQAIKSIMFPKDGTQAVPASYMMKLKIYQFDKHIRAVRPFECNYIVAIQSDSLNLDATNITAGAIIPITFTTMFPNLADDNPNETPLF